MCFIVETYAAEFPSAMLFHFKLLFYLTFFRFDYRVRNLQMMT